MINRIMHVFLAYLASNPEMIGLFLNQLLDQLEARFRDNPKKDQG